MKIKKVPFVLSFAVAGFLVAGSTGLAATSDGNEMGNMMNGNGMMNMMGNSNMSEMMDTPEGQEMMDACNKFMASSEEKE